MRNMNDTPYTFNKKQIPEQALDQGEFWYDRTGRLHLISNMNKHHALNAMRKLLDAHGAKACSSDLFAALTNQASA